MKQIALILGLGFFVTASSAVALSDTEKALCSEESNRRLTQLELHGNARFSEFKFDLEHTSSSNVDFAELGVDSGRRHHRRKKVNPVASAPQMGELVTIRALAKEKNGWRNMTIRCGIRHGKIATFTYEILEPSGAGDFQAPPLSREARDSSNN